MSGIELKGLKIAREKRGYTLEQLSELTGIDRVLLAIAEKASIRLVYRKL